MERHDELASGREPGVDSKKLERSSRERFGWSELIANPALGQCTLDERPERLGERTNVGPFRKQSLGLQVAKRRLEIPVLSAQELLRLRRDCRVCRCLAADRSVGAAEDSAIFFTKLFLTM